MARLGLVLVLTLLLLPPAAVGGAPFPAPAEAAPAPPPFAFCDGWARFIDVEAAEYAVVFDVGRKTASAKSTLSFKLAEPGYPLFDLVPEPREVKVDGAPAGQELVLSPERTLQMRALLNRPLPAGTHSLSMEHSIVEAVRFDAGGVSSFFQISDLEDRGFLERYLPTNLEHDAYAMTLDVGVRGPAREYSVYTNGTVSRTGPQSWRIVFPAHFGCSSVYFHLVPSEEAVEERFELPSSRGSPIPVVVYRLRDGSESRLRKSLGEYRAKITEVVSDLEKTYGPWPHPGLLVQGGDPIKGMEYCGAATARVKSLDHELFHSYLGRGIIPANGNAGWIDEAVATWRERGRPSRPGPPEPGPPLAGRSVYARHTEGSAFAAGAEVIAHLDYLLRDRGGMDEFLRRQFRERMHRRWDTGTFEWALMDFSGAGFGELFASSVYGRPGEPGRILARRSGWRGWIVPSAIGVVVGLLLAGIVVWRRRILKARSQSAARPGTAGSKDK